MTNVFIGVIGFFIISWLLFARPVILLKDKTANKTLSNPGALKAHTKKLSTEFAPRNYLSLKNLNLAADYISSEFEQHSNNVWEQKYVVESNEYKNIVSEHRASSNEVIIVGAHYDAFEKLPGADDNASGVAGLLELNRMLASEPVSVNVLLVAYSLEEPPFFATPNMGSAVHASSLVESSQKIKLMISLEMIGYFSDQPNSQTYPLKLLNLFYPTEGNFIAIVGPMSLSTATIDIKLAFKSSTNIPVYSINGPSLIPGIDFSDHKNYWAAGIDAVMITDTAFFRNFAYHTPDDTYDRLDYERMSEVVNGVYSYLAESN